MSKWIIDPAHSQIGFKIKHLMITNVKGYFKKFNAEVETSSDNTDVFKVTKIRFTADISSIDTGNEQRDQHLKTADFFNQEKHPEIIFNGKKYEGDILEGDLTIAGITKPIRLDVEFEGIAKDPYGNIKAGFTISGKINRKDWGINWNAALESGGFLVGDDVTINADIQLIKQS